MVGISFTYLVDYIADKQVVTCVVFYSQHIFDYLVVKCLQVFTREESVCLTGGLLISVIKLYLGRNLAKIYIHACSYHRLRGLCGPKFNFIS